MEIFLKYIGIIGQVGLLIIAISIMIMIAIMIITTALYIPVQKAIKYNLKEAEHYTEEQRIYLDRYKYVVEDNDLNAKLKEKESYLNELQDKIRKAAAELKSKEAELEKKNKKK